MSKVGVRALKQNASAVVAEALAGEVVVITDRGRPVAQLIALPGNRVAQLVAAGRGRGPKSPLSALGPPPRRKRDRPVLSELVSAMRADERN